MNKNLANAIKYIVFLAVAVGLLFLAFRNIDFLEMKETILRANYWWVLAAVISGYLAVVSRGLRWNILLSVMGYKPSTFTGVHAVSIGYLANLAVPRLGEITRCTVMNREEKIPVDKLIGTVLVERAVDIVFLLLSVLLAFVLKFDELSSFLSGVQQKRTAATGGSGPVFLWAAGAVVLLLLLTFLIFRNTLLSLKWVGKVKSLVLGIFEGFRTLFNTDRKLEFFLHTAFIWGMYFLMSFLYFFSVPDTTHLGPADGLYIMVVGGLAMIVPVPGGTGAFHVAVMMGLMTMGITEDHAAAYAVMAHSTQTLMLIFAGALALFLLYLGRKKKVNAVLQ